MIVNYEPPEKITGLKDFGISVLTFILKVVILSKDKFSSGLFFNQALFPW